MALDQREEDGWVREMLSRNGLTNASIGFLPFYPSPQKLVPGQWDQTTGNPTDSTPRSQSLDGQTHIPLPTFHYLQG